MSLLASLAALIPAFRLLRRRLGGQLAPLAAPLLVCAAGPVVYYAIRQPGYAHPFATLWVAWLVERWDASFDGDAPRSLRTWSLLGLLVGAAALARPQCALWAVILVAAAVDDIRRAPARAALAKAAPRWLAGALVSILVFSPQMLAWKSLHGAFLVVPQGPGFAWWLEPAWSEVLFSSRNGLLPWAPIHALAAIGLLVAAGRTPRVGLALLAGLALQIVANGAAWDWWAGGSFGGRRFDSAAIAFAYGLGALIAWPALWARRTWQARAGQAAIVAALLLSIILAAANLSLASRSASATVPLFGGVPASRVFAGTVSGPVGSVAAAASSVANFPARLLFAWRHDTALDAYDRVVGVHQLGDLYPGLNRWRPPTHQVVALDAPSPRIFGLRPGPQPRAATMTGAAARILLGFNRRDPITFLVQASSPAAGAIELWLDGQRLASAPLSPEPRELRGTAVRARRGVNVLEIRAAAGTVLHSLELRATADPRASLPGN
jgi:hypothetical protein